MTTVDEEAVRERETQALHLLLDVFDIGSCSRCELDYELGLVLGDETFAVGVAVCPNCGYSGQELIADPEGKFSESAQYKAMFRVASKWEPDWHPGVEDLTADWRCACGKTWKTSDAAHEHIYQKHPDKTTLSMSKHSRYPWDNLDAAELALDETE